MTESMSALFAEDDTRLAKFTADYLEDHEVRVTHVENGESAISEVTRNRFDVVILDVMLPAQSGLEVCRAIRERSDVPIVMVTARVEEADRVLGLENGADDYVLKPFSPRELVARLRAMVRRDRGKLAPKSRPLQVGALAIELATRSATLAGHALGLTSAEFELLSALAKHPGRIFSRDQLLRLARGSDADTFDRAIDVQISRMRQKLSVHPEGAEIIRTIRGVGYMLVAGEATE